jgi:hypothetical protein
MRELPLRAGGHLKLIGKVLLAKSSKSGVLAAPPVEAKFTPYFPEVYKITASVFDL